MKKSLKIATLLLAGGLCIYFLCFGFLYAAGFRIYRFPTEAMHPTIKQGDFVVGRLSENCRDHLRRFDTVLYRTARFPGELYAKRVIALSGERIEIDDKGVSIDGERLVLPSSVCSAGLGVKPCDILVPADCVFLLGDSTSKSLDSRHIGPIPKRDIVGYLVFRN